VDANPYPLQEILKPERRYVIPTFQRDYEWNERDQWSLLFDDLESTAARLGDARSIDPDNRRHENKVTPHFFGAIVCAPLSFASGGVAARSVIDGQQRLTTIELLIRGLLDALDTTNLKVKGSLRRMLYNPEDVLHAPEDLYKLWPRRHDRDAWRQAMAPEPPADPTAHTYLQARAYFARRALAYATDPVTGHLNETELETLADALAGQFRLVVIDLDDNDDAQVIFEVLNGRAQKLSAIDLVKNLLFMRAEADGEDVDHLYDTYWAQFDDPWWKHTVGRGHASRGRRDVLLAAWLTATTGAEAEVSHLYREAREYLSSEHASSIKDALAELHQYAGAYKVIYSKDPAEDPRLVTSYERIRGLDITTAVPLLAWLRTIPAEQLPVEAHVRAVRAIESWAARRVYCGWQTRGYGTHFATVLNTARQGLREGRPVDDTIVTALTTATLSWPSDEELWEAFSSRRFYNAIAQPRIRLLLAAIDAQLRNENRHEPLTVVNYDDLDIEHVMPRKWSAHWPLPLSGAADPVLTENLTRARDRAVNLIGNLTLVTSAFNGGVSNLGWDRKRAEFAEQTTIVLNKRIAAEAEWDEATISNRAYELAQVAFRVWPGPGQL